MPTLDVEKRTACDAPWSSKLQSEGDKTTMKAYNKMAKKHWERIQHERRDVPESVPDRSAWRTTFVNRQEFICVGGLPWTGGEQFLPIENQFWKMNAVHWRTTPSPPNSCYGCGHLRWFVMANHSLDKRDKYDFGRNSHLIQEHPERRCPTT